jgi:hypothetical protein
VSTRLAAFGLAVALAVVSSATCLLGAEAHKTEMACCAEMSHDCGEIAIEQDCCALVPAPSSLGILGSLVAHLTAPPLVAMIPIAEPEPAASIDLSFIDARIPASASRPTYLLVSVFRL